MYVSLDSSGQTGPNRCLIGSVQAKSKYFSALGKINDLRLHTFILYIRNTHVYSERSNRQLSSLEKIQSVSKECNRFKSHFLCFRIRHRSGVIDSKQDLVLAFVRFCAFHPDSILPESASDVINYLHVKRNDFQK